MRNGIQHGLIILKWGHFGGFYLVFPCISISAIKVQQWSNNDGALPAMPIPSYSQHTYTAF